MPRALRPKGFNLPKPQVDFPAEEALGVVFVGSQLIDYAALRGPGLHLRVTASRDPDKLTLKNTTNK